MVNSENKMDDKNSGTSMTSPPYIWALNPMTDADDPSSGQAFHIVKWYPLVI